MATKAQRFKAEVERAKHAERTPSSVKKGKKVALKPPAKVAGRRRNSLYELEVVTTARPSRKSTRKSNNRIKTDGVMRINQIGRTSSSKARASRRATKTI